MSDGVRRNSPEGTMRSVRASLLSMQREDLRVRAELVESGTLWDTYHPRMEEVHLEHASRLAIILETHGWPDAGRFGDDGEEAAWLILMHSISRPDLMRRGRELLLDAVHRGTARPDLLARLEDRIWTLEGLPQVYGTILDWNEDGVLAPVPIEKEEAVDARRAAVGLPLLAEHVARCREEAVAEGSAPPADRESKSHEYQVWLRRTGWR